MRQKEFICQNVLFAGHFRIQKFAVFHPNIKEGIRAKTLIKRKKAERIESFQNVEKEVRKEVISLRLKHVC